jgi:flagellar hook-associated protein 1 FlgK
MSSLFGVLNTGRTGLFAQQAALAVTGNNIANANTDGYTRQRVVLDALTSGGVQVVGTQRMLDEFVNTRLRDSNARLAGRTTLALNLSQVESVLGATQDSGLAGTLQSFFSAFQDLSQQPGGAAERQEMLAQGNQLAAAFTSVTDQLGQIRDQLDQQVTGAVDQVNQLTASIAEINGKLSGFTQSNGVASDPALNDLLDQRDKLLNQLSEIVPLRTLSDGKGSMTLFVGDQVLMEGTTAHALTTRVDPSNDNMHEVVLTGLGQGLSLTGKLQDGKLAALVQARDQGAGAALKSIDRLAAQLARDVNVQHEQGTGLDGVSGRDFFGGLQATATAAGGNKGGAAVTSASILDQSQLTFDDYEIRFTASAEYDVVNTTTGTTVSSGNAYTSGEAIVVGGMRVVIGNDSGAPAAGDVFHLNSYAGMGQRIGLSAAVADNPRAIAAGLSAEPGDNRNALQLMALGNQATMGDPPTQTYQAFFNELAVNQSMQTASAQQAQSNEEIVNNQLVSMADSVSGVSLDEESINLIQFQRAFEAASRIISATDELMQALLQMI